MAFTVNINPPALNAIQALTTTNRDLNETQDRVSSGLEVSSARDDAIRFAVSNELRTEFRGYEAVRQSLDRATSSLDIAIAATEAISDILIEISENLAAASDISLSTDGRAAYRREYEELRDRIDVIISTAAFDGTNLIDGSLDDIVAITSPDASRNITVSHEDLSLGLSLAPGAIILIGDAETFASAGDAAALRTRIVTSLENVNGVLARFGAGAQALEGQRIFSDIISDTLETGIGNLVDANLARESARLQSLQVKQQLGLQSLSIANSRPEGVLSLFQG